MNTPYFNTNLYSVVGLHPSQMNNDIYKHLKNNLIRQMQGKCYKYYGYISKIYNIYSDEKNKLTGELIAEDPSASARYKVKFSCKLCKPLRGSTIICEVVNINKQVIFLRNGPINVPIFAVKGQINQKKFIFDDKKTVWIAIVDEERSKGVPVIIGTFVEVKVINTRIQHNADKIFVIGSMENIASNDAVLKSITQREDNNLAFIEHDEYIKHDSSYKKENIAAMKSELNKEETIVSESESESENELDTNLSDTESDSLESDSDNSD